MPTPEQEELERKRVEAAALQDELVEKELDLATLQSELAKFEHEYLLTVGPPFAKLDGLRADIAEVIAARSPDNHQAQDRARTARSDATKSREASSERELPDRSQRVAPSTELKDLFRAVAKKIHPDFAIDEDDRRKRESAMARANAAYENGSTRELEKILREWESSPDAVTDEGIGGDLVRMIRLISQIRLRIEEIEAELGNLRSSELFDLKTRADQSLKEGGDLLQEIAKDLECEIEMEKNRLSTLKKISD